MQIQDLVKDYNKGKTHEFIFFWTGPFSQWDQCGFTHNGIYYRTAEHWMMSEKARLFGDFETKGKILKSSHPSDAKKLGRNVVGFNQKIWDRVKFQIVVNGNFLKFENRKEILLDTGNKVLVEASPVDVIWGIGLSEDDPKCLDPRRWKGQNLLGFALMEVRDILRKSTTPA